MRIRRIRAFEADLLRDINKLAMARQVFGENYLKHQEWLNTAIEDIENGQRVAFGAFEESGKNPGRLLGSVILKRGHFSNHVELKNLLLSDSVQLKHKRGVLVLRRLLAHAREFCEFRGFRRLTSEVPVSASEYVSFHLTEGFHVESLRNSPYSRDSRIYLLSRDLARPYVGDSLDMVAFAKWALTDLFGFEVHSKVDTYKPNHTLAKLTFVIPTAVPLLPPSGNKVSLSGGCYIDREESEKIVMDIIDKAQAEESLTILFSENESEKLNEFCKSKKISLFHPKDLAAASGDSLWLNQSLTDGVGGLLIETNASVWEELKQWRDPLSYVLPNAHGASLRAGNFVLFVMQNQIDSRRSELSVGAIAHVQMAQPSFVNQAWGQLQSQPHLWTGQEFEHFFSSFHANQGRVTLLHLDEIRVCDVLMPLHEVLSSREFQMVDFLWNSKHLSDCYIGVESAAKIAMMLDSAESGFREPKCTVGGLILKTLLQALDAISSGKPPLSLVQRVRAQYGNPKWKMLDDIGKSFSEESPYLDIPGLLHQDTLLTIAQSIRDLTSNKLDLAIDEYERQKANVRISARARKLLGPILKMDLISDEMKDLLVQLDDYFAEVMRMNGPTLV